MALEQINITLDGKPANLPKNIEGLKVSLNFDRDQVVPRFEMSKMEFAPSLENEQIIKYYQSGLIGGFGALVGMPMQIDVTDGNVTERILDGYINLIKSKKLSLDGSQVTVDELKNLDWLRDQAQAIYFNSLYDEGLITDSDFESMPYVLSSVPDYLQAIISGIIVFQLEQSIERLISDITQIAIAIANPFEITAIIRLGIMIAYATLNILACVKLANDAVKYIIQPVKYHKCMNVFKMVDIGLAKLGMTFQTTMNLPDNLQDMCIMPEKYNIPKNSLDKTLFGWTSPSVSEQKGYYNGSLYELMMFLANFFNAKYITSNGVVSMVEKNYIPANPSYFLPDIENRDIDDNLETVKLGKLIRFQVDATDRNTYINYPGTVTQESVSAINYPDKKYIIRKPLERLELPFARLSTKTSLTTPEEVINTTLTALGSITNALIDGANFAIDVVNTVSDVINDVIDALDFVGIKLGFTIPSIPPIPSVSWNGIISNRIGMAVLESDNITVARVFLLNKGSQAKFNKIHSNNDSVINSHYLWNNFHCSDSVLPSTKFPTGSTYQKKVFEKVPMTVSEYKMIKKDESCRSVYGNVKVNSIEWTPWTQKAKIEIWIPKTLTLNLTEKIIVPDGK